MDECRRLAELTHLPDIVGYMTSRIEEQMEDEKKENEGQVGEKNDENVFTIAPQEVDKCCNSQTSYGESIVMRDFTAFDTSAWMTAKDACSMKMMELGTPSAGIFEFREDDHCNQTTFFCTHWF